MATRDASCSLTAHTRWIMIDLGQQLTHQLEIALQQAHLVKQLQQELAKRQQAQAQLEERKQQLGKTNTKLQRATRFKDEFLANMSHDELRTPLRGHLESNLKALAGKAFSKSGKIDHSSFLYHEIHL